MKVRITAIIFDTNKKNHDYSQIRTHYALNEGYNQSIDCIVYDNTKNIIEKLNENRGFDCIVTIGSDLDFGPLNNLSFEFRKKWFHMNEFNADILSSNIVYCFRANINRSNCDSQVFSIFTCAYNTPKKYVDRLYNSLKAQTYNNWNWWIIDDSEKGKYNYFGDIKDPRVHIVKNVTDHGNIGFNKHLIASIADGDYLVEVDHDDELTSDCLSELKRAFDTFKDCDFVYSYAMEEAGGEPITYGDYFALGLGTYEDLNVNGKIYSLPTTPDVCSLSIRHIVSEPNHVRCWKKEFYHKIGGHNTELSVLDDMDILIRTFLNGKMCKIPKVLYIQHEGEDANADRRNGSTTQSKRFDEIQRLGCILREKYDLDIHKRSIAMGIGDPYWVYEKNYSKIFEGVKSDTYIYNYILKV